MQPLTGILYKLVSVVMFMAMVTIIKATSGHVPTGEAVFFRAFFAIPVILAWLAYRGELRHGLETPKPMKHLMRGIIGTCAMGLGFAGLGMLPLPEVTAIGYASPLFTVILAAIFLGERIRLVRMTAVAMGMVGVLIVLSPRLGSGVQGVQAIGAMVVLGSAFCGALASIITRTLVRTEKTAPIVFYFSLSAASLSLISVFWGWVLPTWQEASLLILSGILGGFGQIFLTTSYRHADAGVIAPFDYISMIFALLIGYFLFAEVPTGTMLLGATIVVAAGVLIIWREHALGLKRDKVRKVSGVANIR